MSDDISNGLSQRGRPTVSVVYSSFQYNIHSRDTAAWSARKLSVVCVGHCFTDLWNSGDEDELLLATAAESQRCLH